MLDLKYKFDNFDKNLFKNIFVFSAFLFLNTITDQLTFSTDNIILGIFSGSIMVAIYSVGSNFKNYLWHSQLQHQVYLHLKLTRL